MGSSWISRYLLAILAIFTGFSVKVWLVGVMNSFITVRKVTAMSFSEGLIQAKPPTKTLC